MGAKNDLNEIYLTGCVMLSAIAGGATHSWGVFFMALLLTVGISGFTKKIR